MDRTTRSDVFRKPEGNGSGRLRVFGECGRYATSLWQLLMPMGLSASSTFMGLGVSNYLCVLR